MQDQQAEKDMIEPEKKRKWYNNVSPKTIVQNITVEPLLFSYALGFSISQNISQPLYQDKICQVGSDVFGDGRTWNSTVCDELSSGKYDDAKGYVNDTYNSISLTTLFLKGIPPILFTLFIGPWSDRFGRKMLMILPLFGYLAYNIWFLINVIFFFQMKPEWLMMEVFQYWPGGFMCLFLGAYSYVTDNSSKEYRTLRIAIVDFIFYIGITIGYAIAGKVNTAWGYRGNYAIGIVFQSLAIIYATLAIKDKKKETKGGDDKQTKKMSFFSVFSLNHVKNSFKVVFKKREDGSRHFIAILVLLFGLYSLASTGANNTNQSYAFNKFHFESNEFNEFWSKYSSTNTVLTVVAIGGILPIFTQLLKLNDLIIAAFCLTCYVLALCIVMLAKTKNVLFASCPFQMFHSLTTTVIRAALTKIIDSSDIGKIFAAVGCTQAIIGFLNPLYNELFKATREYYLGFVFCLSATILLIMLVMVAYCIWFWRILKQRQALAKEQAEMEEASTKKDGSPGEEL